jgi:hypothetical protein
VAIHIAKLRWVGHHPRDDRTHVHLQRGDRHCRSRPAVPPAEQLAWRTLSVQLHDLAERDVEGVLPVWQVSAEYAVDVAELHAQVVTMDTPPAQLVGRWLAGWLSKHAGQATHRALVETGQTDRSVVHLDRGWVVLRIGAVTETVPDIQRLAAISTAARLTCTSDGRLWEWACMGGGWFEAQIRPPQTAGHPPAVQLAEALVPHQATFALLTISRTRWS